jgi:hypothetical protein
MSEVPLYFRCGLLCTLLNLDATPLSLPQTLHFKPQTLNTQHSTLHHKPATRNNQHSTINPKA